MLCGTKNYYKINYYNFQQQTLILSFAGRLRSTMTKMDQVFIEQRKKLITQRMPQLSWTPLAQKSIPR